MENWEFIAEAEQDNREAELFSSEVMEMLDDDRAGEYLGYYGQAKKAERIKWLTSKQKEQDELEQEDSIKRYNELIATDFFEEGEEW